MIKRIICIFLISSTVVLWGTYFHKKLWPPKIPIYLSQFIGSMAEDSVMHFTHTPKNEKERCFVILRVNEDLYEKSLKDEFGEWPTKGGDKVMIEK